MSRVIGIDLGTTYSAAAYLDHGRPVIIPNAEGGRLTPSVVAILQDGGRLVGQLAKLQAAANPEGTVFSIKRRLGRRTYLDPDSLTDDRAVIRQIKRRMGSEEWVTIHGRAYAPEEIAAIILQKVKADAEQHLGEPITRAVISVPAYFNVTQRQATMDAARIAGLEVLRILDEPTAAALAYGLDLQEEAHTVLVWDLGGGTFDVSILELGDGIFEVKAVNGDTLLGGDDYDQRIVDYLVEELQRDYGLDLRQSKGALQRLREVAERAKIALTEAEVARIRVPFLDLGRGSLRHWETTLSRERFEALTADLRQKMVPPTRQALADAGLKPEEIKRVILVGGATRMPAVQALIRELLGQDPYVDLQPDEAVALGAAIQAGIITGEVRGRVLLDVTPLSLGIETHGGLFTRIIPRNTSIPVSRGQLFTNAADHQTSMEIHVLQGERELACYNMTLDRFELDDIPPAGRGEARVEVSFHIDADGIVQVRAHDLYGDRSRELRIRPRFYGLAQEELERMMAEAQIHALADQGEREAIKAGIGAESMLRAAEDALLEAEENVPALLREETEESILRLKATVASGDPQETRTMTEELERRTRALARATKDRPRPAATGTAGGANAGDPAAR